MRMRGKLFCCSILLMLVYGASQAQEQRTSPLSITTSRYKDTYVKIVYSQPHKKGRDLFGKLVPYGEVWRTGANEATEITLTGDILVNGQELKAGTYSIFTIPNQKTWTVIFNSDLGLWGAYNYNPKKDILRIEAPVLATKEVAEAFTIGVDARNNEADFFFHWDKTKVVIPVQYTEPKPKP
ncbi:MAG: DUF2911 domain-containing protein [Cyclobacteriaceae bacterium]|nr:DUF2911 domain-containing protein [Cyclobacteriaceae bacterium]